MKLNYRHSQNPQNSIRFIFLMALFLLLPLLSQAQTNFIIEECNGENIVLTEAGLVNDRPSYSCIDCVSLNSQLYDLILAWDGMEMAWIIYLDEIASVQRMNFNLTNSSYPPSSEWIPNNTLDFFCGENYTFRLNCGTGFEEMNGECMAPECTTAEFTAPGDVCEGAEPILLAGNALSGTETYSGTGVVNNMDGTYSFDPTIAGVGGPYTITYTVTSDDTDCEASTSFDIEVLPSTEVFFFGQTTIPDSICFSTEANYSNNTLLGVYPRVLESFFSLIAPGAPAIDAEVIWSGDGITENGPDANWSAVGLAPGNYVITATVIEEGKCPAIGTLEYVILPSTSETIEVSVCSGETTNINGIDYGVGTYTLNDACSTTTLIVSEFFSPILEAQTVEFCSGGTVDLTNLETMTGSYEYFESCSVSGSFLYIPNFSSNNVSVVDANTNTVVNTIDVGSSPIGIAISPNGNFAYVTNYASNNLSTV